MARNPEDIAQEYRQLKASKRFLETRIAELKKLLLPEVEAGRVTSLKVEERNRTSFDEARVHEVMKHVGIAEEFYTSRTVDPAQVEAIYYEGRLTDADLRYIREPKYSYALVDAKEVENVQAEDDSEHQGT